MRSRTDEDKARELRKVEEENAKKVAEILDPMNDALYKDIRQ